MKTILKTLSVIVGLMSLGLGTVFMFAPEVLMEKAQLSTLGNFGQSTIRGLIGGPAILGGLTALIGSLTKKVELLHTSAWIFLSWAIGRGFSIMLDGFDKSVMGNVVLALIMMAVITITYKTITKEKS